MYIIRIKNLASSNKKGREKICCLTYQVQHWDVLMWVFQ